MFIFIIDIMTVIIVFIHFLDPLTFTMWNTGAFELVIGNTSNIQDGDILRPLRDNRW